MKKIFFCILCIITQVLSFNTSLNASPLETSPSVKTIHIITSFSILKDVVHNLVKDIPQRKFIITSIVPLEADPHLYEIRPGDVKNLTKADMLVVNGLEFEGWMNRLIESAHFKGPVIVASESITPRYLVEYLSKKNMPDPHTWHDIKNVISYCNAITEALIKFDSEQKESYQKNNELYTKRLEDLDCSIRTHLQKIPQERRKIVTTHDAFGYFSKAYDIEVLSPVGISTDQEPSPQTIALLIKKIRAENIKAIFIENLANKQLLKKISQEVGHPISDTDVLYADSLSNENGPASTYEDMMRHNLNLILEKIKN